MKREREIEAPYLRIGRGHREGYKRGRGRERERESQRNALKRYSFIK